MHQLVIFVIMNRKPTLFLESHHLENPFFGFGQFNFHFLKALKQLDIESLDITLHAGDPLKWRATFDDAFSYKKYKAITRYRATRIRKKYDLWHALNQNTKIEPYHNIPYLLTVHNITYIKNSNTYMQEKVHQRFQEKLNRSQAITYISEYAKQSTHDFFNVPQVPEYVIYNGNPIPAITISKKYKPTIPIEGSFLFTIGECTARKNFKSLVYMLAELPNKKLVIAGKKTTQEAQVIRDLIAHKNLTGRVFMVGKVSEEDKQWYYKNCEAFVFPSLREGFGLPVIEAMHYGKPVFTSNNTSLPEVGGTIAQYWDHYDPTYMAATLIDGLKTIQANKEDYEKKAMTRASSFSWDKAASQYLKVYKTLLNL